MDARLRWTPGLALIVGVSACDGRSFLQPVTEPPVIVEFWSPQGVNLGGELPVRVGAVGAAGLDSIVIEFGPEAIAGRRTLVAEGGPTDMFREVGVEIPSGMDLAMGIVLTARAYDTLGNASEPAQTSSQFVDATPPVLTRSSMSSQTVGRGETLMVSVTATDNVGLTTLGMRVLDFGSEVVHLRLQSVNGLQASATLEWEVGENFALGEFTIEVFADDSSDNRTVQSLGTIEVEAQDGGN